MGWNARLRFSFFFFFSCVSGQFFTVHSLLRLLFMNSNHKVWLFPPFRHKFYCLWTHKFYFSTTFSLKMGSTVQFIHLKIILLQYFSVFSVSFQLYPNRPLVSFYIMLVGSPHSAIFLGTSICLYYTCNANFYCRHIKKWQILYTFVNNIFYFSCV